MRPDSGYSTGLFHRRIVSVASGLLALLLLAHCLQAPGHEPETDLRGPLYAGSRSCQPCHAVIYNSSFHAAHFNTSGHTLSEEVQRGFDSGFNKFRFNDSVEVWMEKENNRFVQSYILNGKKLFSQPFDIVVGSGRKAQTFLYFNEQKKLSQLPLSYLVMAHTWANSPGFPATDAKFDRNIPSYCLGCHGSFVEVKQTYKGVVMQEEFGRNLLFGIDCERCHGPAREHVQFQQTHPEEKKAFHIIKAASLNRQQKNDWCAQCHSGFRDVQQSLFTFKPGDDLDNFYVPEFGRVDTARLDVHGNQYQLMLSSKCYQGSTGLTCLSCHDVHQTERDSLSLFSRRCQSCHPRPDHSFSGRDPQVDSAVQEDCVSCHLPNKPSSLITLLTEGKQEAEADPIRTHFITVYREETRKFLEGHSRK